MNEKSEPKIEPEKRIVLPEYSAAIERLRGEINKVPIADQMGISIVHYDGKVLQMGAPIEANINDKLTAFGGSLASLAMLSGWSYVVLAMSADVVEDSDVVIVESTQKFRRPVRHRFFSEISVAAEDCEQFNQRFARKGRAKLTFSVSVYDETEKEPAMTMEAVYAAKRR